MEIGITNDKQIDLVYENEDSIDQNLICSVCREPVLEPIIHIPCQNMFCKACMTKLSSCPLCRGVISKNHMVPVPRFVHNTLNELKVICPSCNGSCARNELSNHRSKCPVECPNGCNDLVAPENQMKHNGECAMIPVRCPAADVSCLWTDYRFELEAHKLTCPYFQIYPVLDSLFKKIQESNENLWMLQMENTHVNKENQSLNQENQQIKQTLQQVQQDCVQLVQKNQLLQQENHLVQKENQRHRKENQQLQRLHEKYNNLPQLGNVDNFWSTYISNNTKKKLKKSRSFPAVPSKQTSPLPV